MPCYAGAGTDSTELVNYIVWDEVDVITAQSYSGISDALSS